MRKYWAFYRLGIQNAIAYRGPMLFWLIGNSLGMITMLAVWFSVNASDVIAGYTRNELLSYYVVALFLSWIVGWYPFWIAKNIKTGAIVGEVILKPVSLYWRAFMDDLSWHTISVLMAAVVFASTWAILKNYFIFDLSFLNLLLFIAASVIAIFVVFGAAVCVSILAFWLTESNFTINVFWAFMVVLGGHSLPITFLPGLFNLVAKLSPFRYMFSFPMEIYFHKLTSMEVSIGFCLAVFWAVFLASLYKQLWEKGLKVYTAWGQ